MRYIKTYEDKYDDLMRQPYYDILQSIYHFIERMGFEYYFQDDENIPIKSKIIIIKINGDERRQMKIYAFEDIIRLTYNIKDFILFEFIKEILNDFVWNASNLSNGLYFTLREKGNVYDAISILDDTTKEDFEMFKNVKKYNL